MSIRPAAAVPRVVALRSDPQPGVCAGLKQALFGMRVGGKRSVLVPAELGFGSSSVAAPMGNIPPNSELRFDVEVLRLSFSPDLLTRGIANCGVGGASAQASGCASIVAAE